MGFGSLLKLSLIIICLTWQGAPAHRVVNRPGSIRPIIFVPGDGGSLLEAKLDKPEPTPDNCPYKSDWYRLWLDVLEFLPNEFFCWAKTIVLEFDPSTNASATQPGVTVRAPNFGTTVSMEYIDPSWRSYLFNNAGAYGKALATRLLYLGYERDVSIRGAPFDFRFAMSSDPNGYFEKLAAMVEDTYTRNGNSKVALVSHSLGGLYSTWFLNHQPLAWKEKFVDSFISLSTPWAGSSDALLALTAGFDFGIPIIAPISFRKPQRSFETNYLLMPRAEAFPAGKLFVFTDHRNYTASTEDMEALFHDMGYSDGVYTNRYVHEANHPTQILPPHPGVPTFCIYGKNKSTIDELHFEGKNFPDEQPRFVEVDGDGTVTHASLSLCKYWQQSTKVIELPFVSHQGTLKSNEGINTVVSILFRPF